MATTTVSILASTSYTLVCAGPARVDINKPCQVVYASALPADGADFHAEPAGAIAYSGSENVYVKCTEDVKVTYTQV